MKTFAVHTQESVHGMYHVEAENAEEAQRLFEEQPYRVGEQKLYEAYSAEVERVEEV